MNLPFVKKGRGHVPMALLSKVVSVTEAGF
jgi:hypothetical protein